MKYLKRTIIGTLLFYFVITLWVCTHIYDSQVVSGNWGSISDILIAIFTGLISWATTLLLVVAALNSKEWKNEKQYEIGSYVVSHILMMYLKSFELRKQKVQSFMTYDFNVKKSSDVLSSLNEIKNVLLKGVDDSQREQLEGAVKSIEHKNKIIEVHKDHLNNLNSRMETLERELSILETEVYIKVSGLEYFDVEELNVIIHNLKSIKSNFDVTFRSQFEMLTLKLLGHKGSLPKLDEPDYLFKYKCRDDLFSNMYKAND